MHHIPKCVVLVLVVMLGWTANAQTPNTPLDAGKALMAGGDCRGAIPKFEEAERSPSVDATGAADAVWYRAACLWSLGRKPKAMDALDALIKAAPLYEPSRLDTPPDVRAEFSKRQAAYDATEGVRLGDVVLDGTSARIAVTRNAGRVAAGECFVRAPGDARFEMQPGRLEGEDLVFALPPPILEKLDRAGALDMAITATSKAGAPVARAGDAKAPVSLGISPEALAAVRETLHPKAAPPPPAAAPVATAHQQDPATPPQAKTAGGIPKWPLFVVGAIPAILGVFAVLAGAAFGVASGASWYALDTVVGMDKSPLLPVMTGLATWGVAPTAALAAGGLLLGVAGLVVLAVAAAVAVF